MANAAALPTLPTGLTSSAPTTVTFLTGVAANGSPSSTDGWGPAGLDAAQHKWGGDTAGTAGGDITYGFAAGAQFTAAEQNTVAAALALWSDVANITFTYTANASAQAVFGTNSGSGTNTNYNSNPGTGGNTLQQTTSTTTTFDRSSYGWDNLASFTWAGGYGPHSVVHEIGHVLGLAHAGNYNGAVNPATQQYNATDSEQWSIMSYVDPAVDSNTPAGKYASSYTATGTQWGLSSDGYAQVPTTWMPLDILAAQRLYGVAVNTPLSGGQTFGFNCNVAGASEEFFDFTKNASPVITLWDAGAGNTLDLSGYGTAATVNLNPGTFSSVDGLVNNIGIAYGTAIDRVVSGSGNSSFQGNADSDTVAFASAGQVYFVNPGASGSESLWWAGHTDSLTGIATVEFDGGASTIVAGNSGGIDLAGAGNVAFLTGTAVQLGLVGQDTIVVQSGADTISAAAGATGGSVIFGMPGSSLFYVGSGVVDTIVAAVATISGGTAGVVAFGMASGSLDYIGGSAPATVIGAGDVVSIQGGAGGGLFAGGSANGNIIAGGSGGMTVFGGGGNGTIVLDSTATNVTNIIVAGSGNEFVQAAAATDTNEFFAGSGSDTLIGGSGIGSNYLFAGSGNATLTGGGEGTYFGFGNGQAGGQVVITNWNASDVIGLTGYASDAGAAAAAGQQQVGGGIRVTLPDNTEITFLGIGNVPASRFV